MERIKVGIQLGTLKKFMEEDPDATLQTLKDAGYDCVELGNDEVPEPELKEQLDKYGLEAVSMHSNYERFLQDPQAYVDAYKNLGLKYWVVPWLWEGYIIGHEDSDKVMGLITQTAEILKENGIKMLYHNHGHEFKLYEGKPYMDHLLEGRIPVELVSPEFDTAWVRFAGYDPCVEMKKYAGRIEVMHLKDFVGNEYTKEIPELPEAWKTEPGCWEGHEFRPLGQGIVDFPAIVETCREIGVKYVIVEQDSSNTIPLLEAAVESRAYLKTLGL